MKTITLLLSIGFASICFPSFAQLNAVENKPSNLKPAIATKGYYSIGNNAEQRMTPDVSKARTNKAVSQPVNQKGYYAIGNNHQKLQKNTKPDGAERGSKGGIKKGYYSIGRNSKKL